MSKDRSHSARQAWRSEARALREASKLGHPHLIRCIVAVSLADDYLLFLQWADGGDLRTFWKNNPQPTLTAERISETLEQLIGTTGALAMLHNDEPDRAEFNGEANGDTPVILSAASTDIDAPSIRIDAPSTDTHEDATKSGNWRHGDLKPENILRFTKESTWLGTLQISDLGLAKQHNVRTSLRDKPTSSIFVTRQYEPPEAYIHHAKPRSRRYDI